jgi:hypothetical protein
MVAWNPPPLIFDGPPVTPEMQLLFGPYAGGAPVTGVLQLRDGLHVVYADGSRYTFMPVPAEGCLVAQPDGTFAVR